MSWPDLDVSPIVGAIQRQGDGSVRFTGVSPSNTASTGAKLHHGGSMPRLLVGVTDKGSVLLTGISSAVQTVGPSPLMASEADIGIIVCDLNLESIREPNIDAAWASWEDISAWAGVRPPQEDPEFDSAGNVSPDWSVRLADIPLAKADLTVEPGVTVQIQMRWRLRGGTYSKRLVAPVQIGVHFDGSKLIDSAAYKLQQIQDLISIAYRGFVAPQSALVVPEATASRPSVGHVWSRSMMRVPPGVNQPPTAQFPMFYLEEIGGVSGIARWLDLYDRWPRIVQPIVAPYRTGPSFDESAIVSAGAAIDYWRALHARTRDWAEEKFQPLAVANSVGYSFKRWVGNPEKWSRIFWKCYNGLKHHSEPTSFDAESLRCLAMSGQALLMCVVLQEISDPRAPKRAVRGTLEGLEGAKLSTQIKSWLKAQ